MTDLALSGASPMDAAYTEEWCQGVVKNHALTYAQAHWLISRRWNFVYFGEGRHTISLHPTRADDEITEAYGEHTYRDIGVARITATLSDTRDAIFLPAIYQVASVDILEGPPVEIGEAGQRVEARGKLERIDHGPFHRLVIGSSHPTGAEYLLPVEILDL
jgi:predicted nucleotidyltransferase